MDAKTAYWTGAWLNMALIVALAGAGITRARRGRYVQHERLMELGALLVGLFVVSYGAKLYFLGREALETWNPPFVAVLRVHELCIAVMLVAGATAMVQAHRLGLPASARTPADAEFARGVRLHRRAGKVAFGAALCGVATASYVLFGMYQRLTPGN